MDATENDLPAKTPFTIAGFPTIKFKPAGTKEFIDYAGDRSFEDLVSFIEANAKNDVALPPKGAAGKVVEEAAEAAKTGSAGTPAATHAGDEL